jgi:tRNA(Ile)-lysidine synthase
MIKLSMKLPKYLAVAVSGGADSMAALDFLNQHREVVALHFNHGTSHSKDAESIVTGYCDRNDISLVIGKIKDEIPKGVSKEEFWRKSRYKFFENEAGELPVVTCHHLDDAVETWLFTSFHGDPQLIPSRRGRYLRPFLETRKAIFEDWCERKDVAYSIDPSNKDTSFMRNYIRHEIIPKVLRVNPGLHKVLRKKIRTNPVIFDEAF